MAEEPATKELLRVSLQELTRLRQEADENAIALAKEETKLVLNEIKLAAERAIAIFAPLPCGGEVVRISECSEAFAPTCEQRSNTSCPRNIKAWDEQQQAGQLETRLASSGVPRALAGTAAMPRSTAATQVVDQWLQGTGTILVLAGVAGVGKSVAGAYAIRRMPGRWIIASEISKISSSYQQEDRDRIKACQSARLLVIDDLGAEFADGKGYARAAVEDLLVRRHDEGLRTIVTTNLTAATLKADYTSRLVDRIRDGNGFVVIKGESMRGKKQ